MFRVLIGMISHETNTFSPFPTGIGEFRKRSYLEGEAMIAGYQNTHTPLGAFSETLCGEEDFEIIPSIAAAAEPSGWLTASALEELKEKLLAPLQTIKVDGVLLALHGAMVAESDEDGDGNILQAVRAAVRKDTPVITTLDLHTNLTEKMVEHATALVPYNQYPHADMYERGLRAAELMVRTLRGEIRPVMRWARLPLLTALIATEGEDCRPVREAMRAVEARPGILLASLLHGFYLADTKDTGAAALAIADGNAEAALDAANALADVLWREREQFVHVKTYTPQEALADAARIEGRPVVFADICDNPGAGSTCDGTNLLRALLNEHAERVAFALIVDPETVAQCHAAGVGAGIDIRLGGKQLPQRLGAPIECRAYVKTLGDGRYFNRGPMHGGLSIDLHKSAVVVIDGVTVIVASVATQAYDVEIFKAHGLMPEDYDILVVKSSVHYRAAFGPLCKKMYNVECPGLLVVNPTDLTYTHCRRPIYPLDQDVART